MTFHIAKQIKFLTDTLTQANYEYYNLSDPSLTNQQYDALLQELIILEEKYPQYKLSYSPTFKIGGNLNSNFQKAEHYSPMLSLENVFDITKLQKFYDRILKKFHNCNFVTELKIDGVAISIKYKKGVLAQALTRGNGIKGELITDNIKTIKNIPLKIKKPIDLEVRGEIFFDHHNFEKLNKEQIQKHQNTFANPRNAASGTIRLLDSNIVAKRRLSSFFYTIINPPIEIQTQEEVLMFLKNMGFSVNPHFYVIDTFAHIVEKIKFYETFRLNLNYDSDGIVIKVNQLSLYPFIGYTTTFPKYAIAYKFNSTESETIIKNFSFQIGRTGLVIPIAELVPVIISGSIISRVTLHNYDYIKTNDIRINDRVLIHKSGSIIPQIIKVIKEKRPGISLPFQMITNCPFCCYKLNKELDEVNYFCSNNECKEKKIKKIIHFVSKEAMDINILGEKTISLLSQKGFLNKISDLYCLNEFKNELEKLSFFGVKKVNKILIAIEKSKKNPLDKILFGLGIPHVGRKIAEILANKFKSIFQLQQASINELIKIPEIGIKIAKSIQHYFKDTQNIEEIKILQQHKLNFEMNNNKITKSSNFFYQKRIAITGVLERYSREQIFTILKELGAFITNYLSHKTDYLICGTKSGSKINKAIDLKVKIISEKEFYRLLSLSLNNI
ncbi:NAD-dependent DNA ligase LigA [Candidatus Phytoplasma melaleucae]|uniref:NAD-dependent DNA ligase LigA n=1 Tax=Candidatus Phytoplasma melaleucae TaxID=2982630 RepID=UPI0031E2748F